MKDLWVYFVWPSSFTYKPSVTKLSNQTVDLKKKSKGLLQSRDYVDGNA